MQDASRDALGASELRGHAVTRPPSKKAPGPFKGAKAPAKARKDRNVAKRMRKERRSGQGLLDMPAEPLRGKVRQAPAEGPKGPKAKEPDPDPKSPKERSGWKNDLRRVGKGDSAGYDNCLPNITTILRNDPAWIGLLAFDEMRGEIIKRRTPPWHEDDRPAVDTRSWVDEDDVRLANWFNRTWGMKTPTPKVIREAIPVVAGALHIHPVRDWLDSLKWDGKSRLNTWLIRLGGAEDSPYTRAVAAMFAIGAVARVYKPGCKVDHTLVLEARQGLGKSTMLRQLVGEDWFLETEAELGTKDFLQDLRSKWVIELAELDTLTRSELSRVKAVLTKQVDRYRASYGRSSRDYPRQCVFTGTTNEDQYLKDDTGNRRFLPIKLTKILLALLAKERDQLWAEAAHRYKAGEAWHITDKTLLGLFEEQQEGRRQADPWEAPIAAWVVEKGSRANHGVTTNEVLDALDIKIKDQTRYESMRVGTILRKLGWVRIRETGWGDREYRYYPNDSELARAGAAHEARRKAQAAKEKGAEAEGKLARLADHLVITGSKDKGNEGLQRPRKTPKRPKDTK